MIQAPIDDAAFLARMTAKAKAEEIAEANSQVKNFEPLGDRCLVKRLTAPDEVKVGSIVVPLAARERPLEADVIAVGPGKMLDNGTQFPVAFRPGDRILLGRFSGQEVTLDGDDYLILNESEAFGVVRRAKSYGA